MRRAVDRDRSKAEPSHRAPVLAVVDRQTDRQRSAKPKSGQRRAARGRVRASRVGRACLHPARAAVPPQRQGLRRRLGPAAARRPRGVRGRGTTRPTPLASTSSSPRRRRGKSNMMASFTEGDLDSSSSTSTAAAFKAAARDRPRWRGGVWRGGHWRLSIA